MKTRTFLIALLLTINITTLHSQMYILNEDFSSASGITPPFEWNSLVISGEIFDVWHVDNPGGQTVGFPIISPFPIFDAGAYSNDGQPELVALESPSFDASISNFVILEFDHTFISANNSSPVRLSTADLPNN